MVRPHGVDISGCKSSPERITVFFFTQRRSHYEVQTSLFAVKLVCKAEVLRTGLCVDFAAFLPGLQYPLKSLCSRKMDYITRSTRSPGKGGYLRNCISLAEIRTAQRPHPCTRNTPCFKVRPQPFQLRVILGMIEQQPADPLHHPHQWNDLPVLHPRVICSVDLSCGMPAADKFTYLFFTESVRPLKYHMHPKIRIGCSSALFDRIFDGRRER